MKKLIMLAVVAVLLGLSATACTATDTGSPESADDESAAVSDDPFGDYFDAHPPTEICTGYMGLVAHGWNNDTIYDELNAGGAFDQYDLGDTQRPFYDRLVKWCYQNN